MQYVPLTSKARARRAFTLIEILVVIALSAVLFALLLIPLFNALNYTHQAQSLTAMQDAVRVTREEITRELSSALYVFDNTSHPFKTSNAVVAGDDRYTNFLDLQILKKDGTPIVAHAYNAKLDFVLPKLNDKGLTLDPTTNQPVTYGSSNSGSAIISSPSLVFPAASGTTMIRYWVGLKDPTKSYSNTREGAVKSNTDNTYVLYRAQFLLYNIDPATGKIKANADGTTVNENLFAPKIDTSGMVVNQPELDDPDFFRYVQVGDTNWLDDATNHAAYASAGMTAHNTRVDNWQKIAKPVIPGPNVDLLLLPHLSDNSLAYDAGAPGPCTAAGCPGTAHSGIAHDPVGKAYYPIVSTSVTFRPGTVSGDATPATTSDYNSAGSPMTAGDTNVSYVPTIYTASNKSWTQPYQITLTPPAAPSGQNAGGAVYTTHPDTVTGDLMENNGTADVFDITLGTVIGGATSYIPMTINADSGTITFATPALLDPANDRYKREWVYTPVLVGAQYQVDLKADYTDTSVPMPYPVYPSPLGHIQDPQYTDDNATPNPILTARIVPGSLRVYGPDATAGPGQGQRTLYTEAGVGTPVGENQYTVDYAASVLTFTGATNAGQFAAMPVTVIYDYQANLVPLGTQVKAPTAPNPPANGTLKAGTISLAPMGVSVDYQTRDLISVSIGLRLYDLSTDRAQVIPSETKIKIGNSNR